jgi:hypothetical protein
MSDLAINSGTGDLYLNSTNDLATVDSINGIQQDILQRLSTFFGEWFLDTSYGIDWFGMILVKNPDQKKIDALFVSTILTTPGVLNLITYSSTPNFTQRTMSIQFSCQVSSGVIDYTGTITI